MNKITTLILLVVVAVTAAYAGDKYNFSPARLLTVDTEPWNPLPQERRDWFLPETEDTRLRMLLPRTDSEKVNRLLRSPNLIVYTEAEVPLARQVWNSRSSGVHSPQYDLSGGSDRHGRGSGHEFPWSDPAGTHDVPMRHLIEFRAFHLPEVRGRLLPIVYWRPDQDIPRRAEQVNAQKVAWIYPRGTVFFEALCRPLDDNSAICFSLRMRERRDDYWQINVFAPYVSVNSLKQKLRDIGRDDLARQLDRPKLVPVQLKARHPNEQEIDQQGFIEEIPLWDAETVHALVDGRTYQSTLGERWREQSVTFSGGLNPPNYKAIMDVDSMSCNRCHRSTNRNVQFFEFGRNWYGNIRGSDRILSFHIFDPSCISYNGSSKPVKYREELVQWGLLERYDADKHPENYYLQLSN